MDIAIPSYKLYSNNVRLSKILIGRNIYTIQLLYKALIFIIPYHYNHKLSYESSFRITEYKSTSLSQILMDSSKGIFKENVRNN